MLRKRLRKLYSNRLAVSTMKLKIRSFVNIIRMKKWNCFYYKSQNVGRTFNLDEQYFSIESVTSEQRVQHRKGSLSAPYEAIGIYIGGNKQHLPAAALKTLRP